MISALQIVRLERGPRSSRADQAAAARACCVEASGWIARSRASEPSKCPRISSIFKRPSGQPFVGARRRSRVLPVQDLRISLSHLFAAAAGMIVRTR